MKLDVKVLKRFRPVLALILPFITLSIQFQFWSLIQPFAWFLFFPTVYISAWLGGLSMGLAVTFISTSLVWYYFLPLENSWNSKDPKSFFSSVIFICLGVAYSFLHEAFRKMQLRKSLLEEAAIQNETLTNIVDSIHANIAILDPNGIIVAVNERWRRFASENFATDAGGDIGKKYVNACKIGSDHFDESALEAARGIESVLSGQAEQFHCEYPCHGPHEQRWFMMNVSKLSGNRPGAVVSHIDITKRKLAELSVGRLNDELDVKIQERTASLQASESKYRTLFEFAYDSMLVVDSAGKIIMANVQLLNQFGYAREELIGQCVEVLIPDQFKHDHVSKRSAYDNNPHARPMGSGLDLRGRKKDGTEFPIDISLSPILMPEGRQVTAMIHDITERKKHDDQRAFLAALSKKLSATTDLQTRSQGAVDLIISELADICVLSTLEGDSLNVRAIGARDEKKKGTIENYASHLRTNEGETCLPTHALTVLKPILIHDVAREILSLPDLSNEGRQRYEELGITSYAVIPLEISGRTTGALSFMMTDSGRKFDQSDLSYLESVASRCAVAIDNAKLYAEAKEAVRSRELVLSIVSHDLKNPVSVIDMSAQILSDAEMLAKTNQDQIVERIRHSTDVMLRMIEDLLDFSKAQAGTFNLEKKSVPVRPFIFEALEVVALKAKEKNIQISADVGIDIHDVSGDRRRLVQVLWNLLGNAVKFTAEGGRIRVTARQIQDFVQFTVKDSGPGLSPTEIPKVFNKFWQAAKTAELGTGLGLAIAKGIIQAHDGKIWVESELGQGCEFIFTIPTIKTVGALSNQNNIGASDQKKTSLSSLKIMVVDDSNDNLFLFQKFLEKAEAIVMIARSVAEAMSQLENFKPSVLITDIEMPENDGYELLRQVRQHSKDHKRAIAVLALTAHSDAKSRFKIAEAGFDGQLLKPIEPEKLVQAIRPFLH